MLSHACDIVSPHAKTTEARNGQHQQRVIASFVGLRYGAIAC